MEPRETALVVCGYIMATECSVGVDGIPSDAIDGMFLDMESYEIPVSKLSHREKIDITISVRDYGFGAVQRIVFFLEQAEAGLPIRWEFV